jgi:hypothetical protein
MRLLFLPILCLACLFGVPADAQIVTAEMKTAFLNKLKASIEQKDIDLFSALVFKDAVSDQEAADATDKTIRDTFTSITSGLPPDYAFIYPLPRGQNYKTLIKPVMLIQITPGIDSSTPFGVPVYTFPLGIVNGSLLIVQATDK